MAYVTIDPNDINIGDVLKKELFDKIKSNEDDLNTRITALEAGANKIVIFDEVVINAATLEAGGTITGLDIYRAQSDFTLTDCKVAIFTKGSLTGNLELDVQTASSPDFTSSNSVFTTKPKIVYSTASDYDESNNTVFNATYQDINEGSYLRLDVSELPSGGTIGKFIVYLIGEVS